MRPRASALAGRELGAGLDACFYLIFYKITAGLRLCLDDLNWRLGEITISEFLLFGILDSGDFLRQGMGLGE